MHQRTHKGFWQGSTTRRRLSANRAPCQSGLRRSHGAQQGVDKKLLSPTELASKTTAFLGADSEVCWATAVRTTSTMARTALNNRKMESNRNLEVA